MVMYHLERKRDCITNNSLPTTTDTVSIIMRGTEHPDGPVKKDFVRVQHFTQEMRLKKISDSPPKTEFFINTSFDLMGSIPKSIQNWTVSKVRLVSVSVSVSVSSLLFSSLFFLHFIDANQHPRSIAGRASIFCHYKIDL
jgi:hypothetical protein